MATTQPASAPIGFNEDPDLNRPGFCFPHERVLIGRMNGPTLDRIKAHLQQLIAEGNAVQGTYGSRGQWQAARADIQQSYAFAAGCQNLFRLLGKAGETWAAQFPEPGNYSSQPQRMLGILIGIQKAIDAGMIGRIEDMVLADALGDLLEQAEELLAKGYFLAAGVLGRAVLEEHLRKLCDANGCTPTKARPTMNDYTLALYNGQHLNKIAMKQVEALAAVGNDAAHAKPGLKADDVKKLIADLPGFLSAHPLS